MSITQKCSTQKIATRIQRLAGLGVFLGCLVLADQPAQGQGSLLDAASPLRGEYSTPAMRFFGQGKGVKLPKPAPRRPAPAVRTPQYTVSKPFQNIYRGQAVSPYLSLDTIESGVGIPNYYSRVLPQIQQQKANQAQATELRRLQQQVRTASYSNPIPNNRSGGVPTTGHSSQFLNSGGYFPTIRK